MALCLEQVLCSVDMGSLCLKISVCYQIEVLVGEKKDNLFLISVKHESNGLGRRAVKQSEFCSCVQHVTVSRILKQNHTKLMDL